MSYYSDDDEIDVRVRRHRDASPSPVHYVETVRPPRPRSYYAAGPSYLVPERTVVTTTSRSRSRERRSSPPRQVAAPPPPPVIINNFNGHSSDEEIIEERPMVLSRHSTHSHHGSVSRPRAPSSGYMTREEYEFEETRRELEEMKIASLRKRDDYELQRAKRELEDIKTAQARDRDERNREREVKDHAELRQAKRELDEIKRREERELEEKRIKKELELKRLEEERRIKEEKERRDHAEKEAVERYKLKEAERAAKERKEKEQADKEYQRRLQEDLIKAGVDERQIQAIISKEKVVIKEDNKPRPTYTRMARRHLSIETLRVYNIDFEYDQDPNYILIKRWVPEEEQDVLWRHTRVLREKREKVVLKIEDKERHHHHHSKGLEPEFEWVRKKERRRSKSPGLLMYLAGAK